MMDATRETLACAYLDDASISIGEIASWSDFPIRAIHPRIQTLDRVSPSNPRANSAHAANLEAVETHSSGSHCADPNGVPQDENSVAWTCSRATSRSRPISRRRSRTS